MCQLVRQKRRPLTLSHMYHLGLRYLVLTHPCGYKFCPKVFLCLYNIAFVVLGIFISAIFVYVSLFQRLEAQSRFHYLGAE